MCDILPASDSYSELIECRLLVIVLNKLLFNRYSDSLILVLNRASVIT